MFFLLQGGISPPETMLSPTPAAARGKSVSLESSMNCPSTVNLMQLGMKIPQTDCIVVKISVETIQTDRQLEEFTTQVNMQGESVAPVQKLN